MHKVRIQIHKLGIFTHWVEHASKIKGFVLLASRNTTAGLEAKHLLKAVEVL